MTQEVEETNTEPRPLPEMPSENKTYSEDLSADELKLLMTGNSLAWMHAIDDPKHGMNEVTTILDSLSPEAKDELQFRAFGLTQVRSQIAVEELRESLEDRLSDLYEKSEQASEAPDFDAVESLISDCIDSVMQRHFGCW
ncbi:hypothetical protein [Glutamicibacter arilaitensis]|uniref:hypothetical protein n=1 Tax=Glutamicibacter arilaitensis TaxID=256701 RepID=UPI003FCEF6B7